jgi:hypothetical protein
MPSVKNQAAVLDLDSSNNFLCTFPILASAERGTCAILKKPAPEKRLSCMKQIAATNLLLLWFAGAGLGAGVEQQTGV